MRPVRRQDRGPDDRLDVLVFHANAINSQKTMSAGIDLALGQILAAAGALVATGLITADHEKRRC